MGWMGGTPETSNPIKRQLEPFERWGRAKYSSRTIEGMDLRELYKVKVLVLGTKLNIREKGKKQKWEL